MLFLLYLSYNTTILKYTTYMNIRKCALILIFWGLSIIFIGCQYESKSYVIGVSQSSDDDWREQTNKEFDREAAIYDNLDVIIENANRDYKSQIAQIKKFISDDVDIIIVSPTDSIKIVPIIEQAMNHNIPVIIIDRKIESDSYTAFVGVDNVDIGYKASQYITKALNGKGNIIELQGSSSDAASKERSLGLRNGLGNEHDINIICHEESRWNIDIAKQKADSILRLYPEIDLVFAHNDEIAYSAYLAAKDLGRENTIKFIGVNALTDTEHNVKWVYDGILDATILYHPNGRLVMQTARRIFKGMQYERDKMIETTLIGRNNVQVTMTQLQQIQDLDRRISSLNTLVVDHMKVNAEQRQKIISISILTIIIICILIIVTRMLTEKTKLNIRLKNQNKEISEQKNQLKDFGNKLHDLTQAKLRFFTNISHDLRTPLTLVSDPLNLLLEDDSMNNRQKGLLNNMSRNVNVLLRLVEQIVDFSRIENGKMKLIFNEIDLRSSINEWTAAFIPSIEQRNKRIVLHSVSNINYTISVDKAKIERVYYNLLSNAIKYSYDNSIIHVELSVITQEGGNFAMIKVKNNCNTNVKNNIDNIFDRFFTPSNQGDGSGIGLAITKSYVEAHGGEIMASYLQEESQFQVITLLPLNRVVEDQENATMNISEIFVSSHVETPIIESEIISEDGEGEKPLILIIDDNDEIRQYICEQIGSEYITIDAEDGLTGFDMAKRYIPDLIISDIVMPVMDGYALCKELKQEVITSHIPILMLTACVDEEQRIMGYENGADGYITKPLNIKMLQTRIKNLIENRSLAKKSSENGTPRLQLRNDITTQEEQFVERFNLFLEENYSNVKLNIDDIAEAMSYSRVQLYRKVKALCGESPNQLLKSLRLRKGDLLLRTSGRSVSEIAYEVGFTSPSYFSKNYKEFYGVSPKVTALADK